SGNEIGIANVAVGASGFSQSVTETDNQVLLLIHEAVPDFHFREEQRRVEFLDWTRLLVLSRLLQIDAVAWAIEGHFALLTAALRTNAAMHRRTEALFLAFFADRTGQ